MLKRYFTALEWILWGTSVLLIVLSYLLFDRGGMFAPAASVIGVTSLIFNAKGNPIGQVLMLIFSVLYGYISWTFAYYGEMLTYLGMTAPMAAVALMAWLRHPYQGDRAQVQIDTVSGKEWGRLLGLTAAVTAVFGWLLYVLHTANLAWSIVSVATSFAAAYLTYRRSPWFALAYALNDVVLIVLWVLATVSDRSYLSVVVCFVVFLVNDLYGFFNWRRMQRRQSL